MVIDYDRAAAEYEASLVTKLRGHGAGSFLENWVPDPDPVLGIFNMIEAAWTGGRDQLELLVSKATIDAPAFDRLKEMARAIADIKQVGDAPGRHLQIRRIGERGVRRQAASATRPRPKAAPERVAASLELQEQPAAALHPALRSPLEAETAIFSHEARGTAAREPSIAIAVGDGEVIGSARHQGVQPEVRRRLVEMMCREIEGRTVQDASDHAAVLVIHRLRQRAGTLAAPGILLPANAGTEVLAALEMVRHACRDWQQRSAAERKANFFDPGPGASWRALPAPEKLRRVAGAASAFCARAGYAAEAAKPVRIDKDIHQHEIRVIVQMDGTVPAESVPSFLRRLERLLKEEVERALQVYLEPLKDKNVLRRL